MLAGVLFGKQELRVERVEVPTPGPGDILVKVRVALTCGTDVKVFRRGYHARMIVPPAILGHELAGEIAATGSEVHGFQVGQRVVAANSAPCDQCYFCGRERQNLCEDLLFNNGAYAEYICIPSRIVEKNLYPIPAQLDYRDAAFVEPLACVLKGMEETGIQAGDTVAVIGLGPIGLMFVQLVKNRGARVIAVGRRKIQLDRAMDMGADSVVCAGPGTNPVGVVMSLTPRGRGVDAAIEAVGLPETWHWALQIVRRGGTANLFGGCSAGAEVPLDAAFIHYSEITIKSSFHHTPATIRSALETICRGDIRPSQFITDEARLGDLPHVFRSMLSHNGHMKTAIVPD